MRRLIYLSAVTLTLCLTNTGDAPAKSLFQGFVDDLNTARNQPSTRRQSSSQFSRAERVRIQEALNEQGFDVGRPDGAFGAKTRDGISAFQNSIGAEVTGRLTKDQAAILFDPSLVNRDGDDVREAETEDEAQQSIPESTPAPPSSAEEKMTEESSEPPQNTEETQSSQSTTSEQSVPDNSDAEARDVSGISAGMSLQEAEEEILGRMSAPLKLDGQIVSASLGIPFGRLRAFSEIDGSEAYVLLHVPDGDRRIVVGISRIIHQELNTMPSKSVTEALSEKYGAAQRKEQHGNGAAYMSWFDGNVVDDPQTTYQQCDRAGGTGFDIEWTEKGEKINWQFRPGATNEANHLLHTDGPVLPEFDVIFGNDGRAHLNENATSCFLMVHAAINENRSIDRRQGWDTLQITLIDFAWYKALKDSTPELDVADPEQKNLKLDL